MKDNIISPLLMGVCLAQKAPLLSSNYSFPLLSFPTYNSLMCAYSQILKRHFQLTFLHFYLLIYCRSPCFLSVQELPVLCWLSFQTSNSILHTRLWYFPQYRPYYVTWVVTTCHYQKYCLHSWLDSNGSVAALYS